MAETVNRAEAAKQLNEAAGELKDAVECLAAAGPEAQLLKEEVADVYIRVRALADRTDLPA